MALKTLADCKPSDFLRQTNRIRKAVAKWMDVTEIASIRTNRPKLEKVPADATTEEKAAILKKNDEAIKKQQRQNMNKILEAAMEKHPDETLELLALCCFVEPENVDDHPVAEYLEAFSRLIGDEAVVGFFTSMAKLGQSDILT